MLSWRFIVKKKCFIKAKLTNVTMQQEFSWSFLILCHSPIQLLRVTTSLWVKYKFLGQNCLCLSPVLPLPSHNTFLAVILLITLIPYIPQNLSGKSFNEHCYKILKNTKNIRQFSPVTFNCTIFCLISRVFFHVYHVSVGKVVRNHFYFIFPISPVWL